LYVTSLTTGGHMSKGLGHFPHKDSRDALFTMGDNLNDVIEVPDATVWERGDSTDQGREGACVGFGWGNWHNCKPKGYMNQVDNTYCFGIYRRAQENDAWPGTDYEGTSVRAGAKTMLERFLLDTYLWARSLDELDAWLLTKGPVVVASNWYRSMDTLTSSNFVQVDVNSGVRGGHCYLLYGKDEQNRYYFQNSWGDDYGDGGSFYMSLNGLKALWNFGQFEAVTAVQTRAA